MSIDDMTMAQTRQGGGSNPLINPFILDDFDDESVTTAKVVVRRAPGNTVRAINLPHLQSVAIEAASSLERDFTYVALAFPFVRRIVHQPFVLELELGTYTPDFLVCFLDGSRAVAEVKPAKFISKFQEKLDQARSALGAHAITFLIAHDGHLRKDGIESRAKQIRRYAKGAYPQAECELARSILKSASSGVRIRDLVAGGVQKTTVLHMVSHQQLEIGRDLDIADEAIVRLPTITTREGCHAIRFASWLDA